MKYVHLKWLVDQVSDGKNILLVSPTHHRSKQWFNEVMNLFRDIIDYAATRELLITFKTGAKAEFVSSKREEAIRGKVYEDMKVEYFDEASELDERFLEICRSRLRLRK